MGQIHGISAFQTLFGLNEVQYNRPLRRRSLLAITFPGNGGIGLVPAKQIHRIRSQTSRTSRRSRYPTKIPFRKFHSLQNIEMQLSWTDAPFMRTTKNIFSMHAHWKSSPYLSTYNFERPCVTWKESTSLTASIKLQNGRHREPSMCSENQDADKVLQTSMVQLVYRQLKTVQGSDHGLKNRKPQVQHTRYAS